jgi:hypothetical protein
MLGFFLHQPNPFNGVSPMQLAIAGAASGCPKNTMFDFKLTGADVMHWQPKSRLQQLWERLLQVVAQENRP